MARAHRHRARGRSTTTGWTHCVASGVCTGTAHGGVVHRDVCACGATRLTESNGRHTVYGPWLRNGEEGCYADEIETLREMLDDIEVASFSVEERERRVKALTTAIEALGGAL